MPEGFIKLSRSLLEWEWKDDPKTAYLYIVMLLLANHDDSLWRGESIRRGQLLSGRRQLSIASGLSEREVRTALEHLKKTGHVSITSKTKYSIITLILYDKHCCIAKNMKQNSTSDRSSTDQQNDQQLFKQEQGNNHVNSLSDRPANDQQATSKRPTSDQQATTSNNLENVENIKNDEKGLRSAPATARMENGNDELHSQIGNIQRASALIRRYSLTDNEATLEALLEDAERHGFDAIERALKTASESDRRGGISVKFYRAILLEKRGSQIKNPLSKTKFY